jgi:hypothetical protein
MKLTPDLVRWGSLSNELVTFKPFLAGGSFGSAVGSRPLSRCEYVGRPSATSRYWKAPPPILLQGPWQPKMSSGVGRTISQIDVLQAAEQPTALRPLLCPAGEGPRNPSNDDAE